MQDKEYLVLYNYFKGLIHRVFCKIILYRSEIFQGFQGNHYNLILINCTLLLVAKFIGEAFNGKNYQNQIYRLPIIL